MLKIGIIHFIVLAIVGMGYYSTAGFLGKLQPRIVKGNWCNTAEVSSFVVIEILRSENDSRCGGSLLTYEWVLTAAHCVSPSSLEDRITVKVYSAFDMQPQLRQVRNMKEAHIHPNFVEKDFLNASDFRYDIGLMLVDQPFRQTVATRVATLPTPGFAKKCKQVMVAGIGETYNNQSLRDWQQRPLMCASLGIYDANSCKRDYIWGLQKIILFDDTIMCMFQEGKGPCRGDSGGPVLCDNVVIGLNSYGPADCEKTPVATAFTMVEKHLDFLDNFVKFTKKNNYLTTRRW